MPANVRIRPESYAKLRELAGQAGVAMHQVLAEAIDNLYRKRFLDRCDHAYARLKANSAAWQRELAERQAWEQTLNDGLDDE